ncbi:MAG: glycosyltransferase family 39 protein [bacterium]
MRLRALDCALIALLGAALYLPGLGSSHSLWNPDEPRFAEIARVMLTRGEWLTPTLNGEPYSNKPPLLFWSIATVGKADGGVSELAARLPSALAAIGVLVLTGVMAARIGGRRVGWLAVAVLATAHRFAWQARWCQTDMLLTLWVMVALTAYHAAVRRGRLDNGGVLALYGGTALGVLTKGLAAPVITGLAVLADLIRRRAFREIPRYRLVMGTLVFLGLAAPWFVAMAIEHGSAFPAQFFLRQHLQRFVDPFDHAHNAFYYLYTFPAEFLPWTVVLPGVALVLYRDRALLGRLWFPLGWFALTFAFFSAAGAKRGLYLLPAYPAAAIVVGAALERWIENKRLAGFPYLWFDVPLWAVPALIGGGALVAPLVVAFLSRADVGAALLAALLLAPLGAGLAVWGARGARERLLATFGSAAAVVLVTSAIAFPRLDGYKSAKPLAAHIASVLPPDVPLALYQYDRAHFNFYLRREFIPSLDTPEQGVAYLRASKRACVLTETKHLAELEQAFGASLARVAADSVGHRKLELACADR